MSRASSVEPLPQMLGFMNPQSTGHDNALSRLDYVQHHLLDQDATVKVVEHASEERCHRRRTG